MYIKSAFEILLREQRFVAKVIDTETKEATIPLRKADKKIARRALSFSASWS